MPVEVVMPRLSDSMEEGTVLEWHVAEGDTVARGQVLADIETDKATMPYEADSDGVLLRILCAAGETAALGAPIAVIGQAGEAAPADAADETPAAQAAGNGGRRIKASPVARRVAAELDVQLAGLHGTGPAGRVVKADVQSAADPAPGPETPPIPAAEAPAPAPPPAEGAKGAAQTVELTRVQRTVARRMAESRATVPDFELAVDVDMGACADLRERLRAIGADPLPSYNDMIVKACASALRELPRANGAYRDGSFELYDRVNVGVAVASDDALVVPTVFDADKLSLGVVARATRQLAARVRDGSITAPELSGGTFTVSNLGMFGVDRFTAVINQPQAAILAVGAVQQRPTVDEAGRVVARPLMTLTLACDHRILYGADGAQFLTRVRELLEQPLAFAL